MKKSVMKSLAAFLAFALMVASLPVAVFAEEPEHCHDEMCCPDSEAVVNAINNCPAGGSHVYMSTFSVQYVPAGTDHLVKESILHTCAKCGYFYHEFTGVSYHQPHSFTVVTLADGTKYRKCFLCGQHEQY